ncbi:MAG: tetratricopeptide repeat protein [Reichenbachiella sp.]|uniref:tetratricopeptide repeat protein n=1 Tax=Reichenbachiella sp. TaxID=2184521 RepID=UPI0029672044|nr:tetratricopeptide repeat protein [Reichenbachiella sp.]MDW3210143.1 tetratricopeptide repeat protein [Reichenbachiella sp.]
MNSFLTRQSILILSFLFLSSFGFSNATSYEIDSLKELVYTEQGGPATLLNLSQAYSTTDLDSAFHFADQLESWSNEKEDNFWLAKAKAQKASLYSQKNIYDSAVLYAEVALSLFDETGNKEASLWPLKILGSAYLDLGQQEKALAEHLKGLKIAEDTSNKIEAASFLNAIGNSYRKYKDSKSAIAYLERALELSKSIDYENSLPKQIFSNLALAYDMAEQKEKSIDLLKSVLSDFELTTYDSSKIYTNIARSYIRMHLYDSALKFLDLGIPLRERIGSPNHNAYAYKEYATLYAETNQFDKSITYGEQVREIGEELENSGHLEDAYRNLREAYYGAGDYKKSTEYGKKYIKVFWKRYNSEKRRIITEMDTKYQTVQKENEIVKLEAQKAIDEKTKTQLAGIIVLIVVIAIFFSLQFKNSIEKQKSAKKMAETQLSLNKKELQVKEQQLSHFVQVIQEKNHIVEQLENQITLSAACENEKLATIDKLTKTIILTEDDWLEFKAIFENVYDNFFTKVKSLQPSITSSEMRLTALMKLNLSTKEISNLLGISPDSVTKTKYRVKKKLALEDTRELEEFVSTI